jgi:hypothetical protein
MRLSITIGGVDITQYVKEESVRIQQSVGGALENFDTASFTMKETGNFLVQPYYDTVSRANATSSAGSLEYPQNIAWSPLASSVWTVSNERIYARTHGSNTFADVLYADVGQYDLISISANVLLGADSNQAGLAFRITDVNNYLYALVDNTGTIEIGYIQTGTPHQLYVSAATAAWKQGGTIRVDLNSTLINVYITPTGSTVPVLVASLTSGFNTTATKHGLWIDYAASTLTHSFKNFQVAHLSYVQSLYPYEFKEVVIADLDSGYRLFGGLIDYTERKIGKGLTFLRDFQCKEYGYLLQFKALNKSYTNYTDAAIINDILSNFPGSYFTQGGSIQSTATIPYFSAFYITALEAIRQICQITGAKFTIDKNRYAQYYLTQFGNAPCSFSEKQGSQSSSASIRTMYIERYARDLRAFASRLILIGGNTGGQTVTETITSPTLQADGTYTYQLQYGNISNIQSFTQYVAGFGTSVPTVWTYKDTVNPRNTQVSSPTSVAENGVGVPTASKFTFATLSTLYFSSGEKLVAWSDPTLTKFYSSKINFELRSQYGLNIFEDHLAFRLIAQNAFTGGGALVDPAFITYDTSVTNKTNRAIWVGSGWEAVVDQASGLITFSPGGIIPSATNPVTITYTGSNAVKVVGQNAEARSLYGGNNIGGGDPGGGNFYHDLIIKDDSVNNESVTNAQNIMTSQLRQRSNGVTTGRLRSQFAAGCYPGQLVKVESPTWQINDYFQINRLEMEFHGAGLVTYYLDFGDYSPEEIDMLASILRAKNSTQQDTADPTLLQTLTLSFNSMHTHLYDAADSIYNQPDVNWS